ILGAALVLIAFLEIFWRIVVIDCHAPDIFGTMLCVGVMVQLAIQVVINIAVVTNSIPSTGIPLPFISYGGTSEMIMMAEMGLVLGVSRQIKQK
ncbi:MAG: FtsW/RodA/SpoVE family cell cycle protein, partial [Lachnospiraceae bacterium]|nr:FtsW/RodA/SpoVE family cell cycle protein [Lachnospiraceae bacterium]